MIRQRRVTTSWVWKFSSITSGAGRSLTTIVAPKGFTVIRGRNVYRLTVRHMTLTRDQPLVNQGRIVQSGSVSSPVLNILFNVLLYCRYCSLVFTQSFFYAKELMEIVNKRSCSGVFCRMATLKNFIKLLGKNPQKTCKISVPYKNTLSRVVSRWKKANFFKTDIFRALRLLWQKSLLKLCMYRTESMIKVIFT